MSQAGRSGPGRRRQRRRRRRRRLSQSSPWRDARDRIWWRRRRRVMLLFSRQSPASAAAAAAGARPCRPSRPESVWPTRLTAQCCGPNLATSAAGRFIMRPGETRHCEPRTNDLMTNHSAAPAASRHDSYSAASSLLFGAVAAAFVRLLAAGGAQQRGPFSRAARLTRAGIGQKVRHRRRRRSKSVWLLPQLAARSPTRRGFTRLPTGPSCERRSARRAANAAVARQRHIQHAAVWRFSGRSRMRPPTDRRCNESPGVFRPN
jgi:hypothetical protein